MHNYLKASVISIFLLTCGMAHSQISDEQRERYYQVTKKAFSSCEEGQNQANRDVESDSLFYILPGIPSSHNREYVESPKLYLRKQIQLDSIMYSQYGIKVIRSDYGGSTPDYTAGCYNRAIQNHMDTTYGAYFMIEALNIIAALNGEPPVDSTWVKQKKVPNHE